MRGLILRLSLRRLRFDQYLALSRRWSGQLELLELKEMMGRGLEG
jgi:hypothetical protein